METTVEHYLSLGEPRRSQHLWRYTPWRKIHPTGKTSEIPGALIAEIQVLNADGTAVDDEITLNNATAEDYLRLSTTDDDNITVSFCRAISERQAVVLSIPNSWRGSQPLSLEITASGHVSNLHLLLDIGDNVESELVISIRGDAGWFGILREGCIGKNSRVSELLFNRLDSSSTFVRSEQIKLSRDTDFNTATLSLGAVKNKSDIRYELNGIGSNLGVFMATHGTKSRHNDSHIEIEHKVGKNTSQVEVHAACDGKSRTIGTGLLKISNDSQKADAGQVFRNLLLSDKAKADSIPELEVLSDDVSANHGAASAPLDSKQIFYLQSRGLGEKAAKDLIVEGFLMDAFRDFPSEKLVEKIKTLLVVHLDCDLI